MTLARRALALFRRGEAILATEGAGAARETFLVAVDAYEEAGDLARAGHLRDLAAAPPSVVVITEREARHLDQQLRRYESARRRFDPVRYQRGGAYEPEELDEIEHMAGGRDLGNTGRGRLDLWRFYMQRPQNLFVYWTADSNYVSDFSGEPRGRIVHYGAQRMARGVRLLHVRVKGFNGVLYGGTCNADTGSYCRLRALTSKEKRHV